MESNPKRRRINGATVQSSHVAKAETSDEKTSTLEPTRLDTFETLKSAIIRKEGKSVLKSMIDRNRPSVQLWKQTDDQGYNMLHIATQFEHLEAMQYSIELGVDVNSTNSQNNTPLHIALNSQKKESFLLITRLLLENGAKMHFFDEKDNTFVHLLPYYLNTVQYHDAVNLLISMGYGDIFHAKNNLNITPLHMAVEEIDVDTATLKLISTSCGFDFNKPETDGSTLLHYAARWGGTRKTLENLISLGADWKRRNGMQETVLHLAVEGNNFDAINYFISLGADVNARDGLGRTTLHHIESHETESKKHYIELTKLLLEHGADIYAKDNYGETVANDLFSEASREDFEKWAKFVVGIGHGKLFEGENETKQESSPQDSE